MEEALESARVTALLGARQAGKTTLVRQLATRRGMAYVTLDDDAAREAALADPGGFARALGAPAAIDEIQRAPALLLAIKRVVDTEPRPGRFLVTGSANLQTLPAVADALPGRVDYLRLDPLSEREIALGSGSIVDRLFAPEMLGGGTFPGGREALVNALVGGGFPEARVRTPRARSRFFDGYVTSLVERDVEDVASLRSSGRLGDVLRLAAARSGGLGEPYALGRELGIDGKTARAHLDALERLFVVARLPAWSTNLGARVTRSPLLHVADTGLLAHLLGADAEAVLSDLTGELAGRLVEALAVSEILRQSRWATTAVRASYYRDQQQREIDLLLEAGMRVVAVEIKASQGVTRKDARHLAHVRDRLGGRFVAGYVFYTGEVVVPLGDRLSARPVTSLWLDPA